MYGSWNVGLEAIHHENQVCQLVSGLPGIIWVVSTPMEVLTCGAEAQRTGPRPESLITEYSDFPTPDLTYDLRTGILALPSLLLVSAPAGSHLPWHL